MDAITTPQDDDAARERRMHHGHSENGPTGKFSSLADQKHGPGSGGAAVHATEANRPASQQAEETKFAEEKPGKEGPLWKRWLTGFTRP